MTAKKFFDDNISRTNPTTDPLGWNLNHGLAAMAQDMQRMQLEIQAMHQEMRQALQALQWLQQHQR